MVRIHIKASIFILLATFTSFKMAAEFPQACLSKLFPNFNEKWEKYVIYFLNTEDPLHDQPSPDSLLNTRIVVAKNMEALSRGDYRFSDTFNVVIHQLQEDYLKQIARMWYLNDIFVPSRSIYMFTTSNNGENALARNLKLANWYPKLQVFPTLKLILTLPQSTKCNPKEASITVVCSGYCSTAPRPVADFEKGLANADLYTLHHSLFWNANRKVMPAVVADTNFFIENTPKAEQGVCLSQTHRINLKCIEGIMTMLTYGEIHNMTINLLDVTMENVNKYGVANFMRGPEQLTFAFTVSFYTIRLSIFTQFMFESFDSRSLIYCPLVKNTGNEGTLMDFGFWYEPFTPAIWLNVLSIFIFGIVSCYINYRHLHAVFLKLIKFWAAVFGADINPRYFMIVGSLAFLLTQIYSNGLTSIITVGKTPEGFKTIGELLQAGYKILFSTEREYGSIEDSYGHYFKRLGLSTDGAFELSNTTDLESDLVKLSQKNARLSFPQTFSEELAFSLTETENRYWIYVTTQRIRASGLLYKWNEWSRWHQMLNASSLDGKYLGSSDFVNRPKFLAMQFIWGTLLIFSLAIFCVETKLFRIREGIIDNMSVILSFSNRLFRRQSRQPAIMRIKVSPANSSETRSDLY
ncbi:unnamed protein product [Orchesella dallaii]|uniref:Ionotropic receptor n=1 Tax=Orchesella dallaii TaxID=48710 RepID=A0ABP1RVJ8_9HEXA